MRAITRPTSRYAPGVRERKRYIRSLMNRVRDEAVKAAESMSPAMSFHDVRVYLAHKLVDEALK